MATKISVFKSTADGEQVNVEIELTGEHLKQMEPRVVKRVGQPDEIIPGKSIREMFSHVFNFVDQRLFEVNLRIMVAQAAAKKFPADVQVALNSIMETLHGRNVTGEFAAVQREVASEVIEKLIRQGMDQEQVVAAAKRAIPALNEQPANQPN